MLRQTRHAFELRPNPAVDMNDPDLFFVDIIPRINWGKPMMENATDIGFLQLDKSPAQAAFRGRSRALLDSRRVDSRDQARILGRVRPAPAPESAIAEPFIVVRAMTASGPWETWFYSRQYKFRLHTEKRRLADALELESKIRELV